MRVSIPGSALITAIFFAVATTAQALIIFGLDNAGNTSAPANGAPWSYVVRQDRNGNPDASGVYLGNNFVLTANHTNTPDAVFFNGQSYARDTSFVPVRIGTTDLEVYKIVNGPAWPLLPLALLADGDLNADCTLIAWGRGKGAEIPDSGWNWGALATTAQRWGSNKTLSTTSAIDNSAGTYTTLVTNFNKLVPPGSAKAINETAVALGDSGSGLFQLFDGTWKLSGVASLVSSTQNQSLYSPPDSNFFVRMKTYADALRLPNWKEKHLGDPDAPDESDHDGDGIRTLLEYALGLDPDEPDAAQTPVIGMETNIQGEFWTFTYRKVRTAVDLVYQIEESSDLADWDAANITQEQVVSTAGLVQTIKALIPVDSATRRFFRLKATSLQ